MATPGLRNAKPNVVSVEHKIRGYPYPFSEGLTETADISDLQCTKGVSEVGND